MGALVTQSEGIPRKWLEHASWVTPQSYVIRIFSDSPILSEFYHIDVPAEIGRAFPRFQYGFSSFRVNYIDVSGVRANLNCRNLQAINLFRPFGSKNTNNHSSRLSFPLITILTDITHVLLLSLSRGDFLQGLMIGIRIAKCFVQDTEVLDDGIGCLQLFRGEGLRRLRPRRCHRLRRPRRRNLRRRRQRDRTPRPRHTTPRTRRPPATRHQHRDHRRDHTDATHKQSTHHTTPPLVPQIPKAAPPPRDSTDTRTTHQPSETTTRNSDQKLRTRRGR